MASAVAALAVAILLGTVGFSLIEELSLLDSLYLTVQTITTVGFGDVQLKTAGGRLFAVAFMLGSVSAVAYLLSTAVQSIVESELIATFGQRRRSRKMSKLHNHYIVCGAGRVGSHLVRQMQRAGETFVVIENDADKVQELNERKVLVLQRDATIEETLHDAGVEHARGLAACLPDDSDNLYVVLTARGLNPNLHIVARAAEESAERKLKRAGANVVVAPTIIGGHRLAVALRKPAVGEFIDSITVNTLGLEFEQVAVEMGSPLAGRKLRDTINRNVLDVVIVSIQRKGGEALFNPQGDTQIEAGDVLIAIGGVESLEKLNSMASGGQ
ncbi:MAG: voltage-gated potassium channel [Blastocatellia bacterium]|jgi:voltage-gated potassium channel|nr:voltage-gated potassium channel [Blastocatellia bacterium]